MNQIERAVFPFWKACAFRALKENNLICHNSKYDEHGHLPEHGLISLSFLNFPEVILRVLRHVL